MTVLAGGGNGHVHILRNDHAAQQVGKDLLIFGIELDQLVAQTHDALFIHHLAVLEIGGTDGGQGQEGGTAGIAALQVLDGRFAVFLGIHHNVLHSAAQCGLDGHGIPVGHMDQSGHRTVDAVEGTPLGIGHDYLDGFGIALVHFLHFGEHMDAGVQVVLLHFQIDLLAFGVGGLLLAALQAHLITGDNVAQTVSLVLGFFQLPGHGFQTSGGLLHTLFQRDQFLADGLLAVQQFLSGGGQSGQQRTGLGSGGILQIGLLTQAFQLVGQCAGVIGQSLRLGSFPGDLGADGLHLGGHSVQTLPALGDLGGDGAGAALLRLHLAADTLGVLQIVSDIILDQIDGVFALVGVGLHPGDLKADGVGLNVLAPHLLGKALGGGIQALHLPLRFFLLTNRIFIVCLYLNGSGTQLFQLLHPHGNLQHTQLVTEDQKFLGLLRLHTQGFHLQFQLVDLVVDAHQILIGTGELTLGLLLAVAEAGNAGGLFKDLAAVGRFDGQDLVDLALTDDGITLAAQTGVHEQLVHVLQTDTAAVDVVFTFAGAVIPAGDHDFTLIQIEDMFRVVNDQTDLGKAKALSFFGTAEDDVLHLGSAQSLGGLLTHDPADGIRNIGFSRPVGAHHGGDILAKRQDGLVREGFEALDLERF